MMKSASVHCTVAFRAVICTSAYPFGDKRRDNTSYILKHIKYGLGQEVSGSIPGSGEVLLGFFRFFEKFLSDSTEPAYVPVLDKISHKYDIHKAVIISEA
ncbi:hypothetical protein SFRURICE_018288, partial [Spodoptera frugiperda]